MIELEAKIRKWGNSMGILLPRQAVKKEKFKDGETVKLFVAKKTNPIKETFGIYKHSKVNLKTLKEIDKEAWDE